MPEQGPRNPNTQPDVERQREERRRQHEEWKKSVDWEHRSGIERMGLLMMYAAGNYQAQKERAAETQTSPTNVSVTNTTETPENIQKDPLLKWLWNFRQKRIEKESIKEQRERHIARGIFGTSAAVGGLALAGTAWTFGHLLKYAFLGWTLDASGVPKVDKEALANFDKWYRSAAGLKKAA